MQKIHQLTVMLGNIEGGGKELLDQIFPIVYSHLREMAAGQMRKEKAGHTLQPTELVNKAYLRLVDQTQFSAKNRAHFYAIAATAMRRILIDYARQRQSIKRGGDQNKVSLEDATLFAEERAEEFIQLDKALEQLTEIDARQASIVELRYFVGLTVEETAEVLNLSRATIHREWRTARAWLFNTVSEMIGSE